MTRRPIRLERRRALHHSDLQRCRTSLARKAHIAQSSLRVLLDQQYLDKHPYGYRCHANAGAPFPADA